MKRVLVEVFHRKNLIDDGGYTMTDPTGGEDAVRATVGDRYELLEGNRGARVRVTLGETIGGPDYSSVRVSVDVQVSCNQDAYSIAEAQQALFEDAKVTLGDFITEAWEMLEAHLDKIHGPPDGG